MDEARAIADAIGIIDNRIERDKFIAYFLSESIEDCVPELKAQFEEIRKIFREIDQYDEDVARVLIGSYCHEEFGSDADMSDMTHIPIGYGESEDEKHSIQAYANIINYSINRYIDGELAEARKYDSFIEFTRKELINLDYTDLTLIEDEKLQNEKKGDEISL